MKTKFYEVTQNNSGGSFDVDATVCHRLFIEANSENEADEIAENLGCYWNGVENDRDCSCCGDRWYGSIEVKLEDINTKWKGHEIYEWLDKKRGNVIKDVAIQDLKSRYPGATWLSEPVLEEKYGSTRVIGRIGIDNIEQYAQVMADQYGWTRPDCRIFYKNGEVKEIFSKKVK